MATSSGVSAELAPIAVGGSLSMGYRTNGDSDGRKAEAVSKTLNLNISSFIYEPWWATWQASVSLSEVDSSDSDDIRTVERSNNLVTGRAQLNLYPESRFPGTAFVESQDTRLNDSTDFDYGDSTIRRIGYDQRYRSEDGETQAAGSYHHIEEEQLDVGRKTTTNRFLASGNHRRGNHVFDGAALAQDMWFDPEDGTNQLYVANLNHSYTPTDTFTSATNLNVSETHSSLDPVDLSQYSSGLTNTTQWQASEKLRIRSRAALRHLERESNFQAGSKDDSVDVSVTGVYDVSKAVTVDGEVAALQRRGSTDEKRTRQSVGIDYSPDDIPVGVLTYNRNLGAEVRNETYSDRDTAQIGIVRGQHGLSYMRPPVAGGWLMAVNVNQAATHEEHSTEGSLSTLSHRASVTTTRPRDNGSTVLTASALDYRSFGRIDSELQTITGTATQYSQINKRQDWTNSLNGTVGRSASDGRETEFMFFSASSTYRDRRWFDVPGLTLDSELRADYRKTESLLELEDILQLDYLDDGYNLSWRNRVSYSIGLLELRLTTNVARSETRDNWSVFFSATRRF